MTPQTKKYLDEIMEVRALYPSAHWVEQAEYNREFNAASPSDRKEFDLPFGFGGLRISNGPLLISDPLSEREMLEALIG